MLPKSETPTYRGCSMGQVVSPWLATSTEYSVRTPQRKVAVPWLKSCYRFEKRIGASSAWRVIRRFPQKITGSHVRGVERKPARGYTTTCVYSGCGLLLEPIVFLRLSVVQPGARCPGPPTAACCAVSMHKSTELRIGLGEADLRFDIGCCKSWPLALGFAYWF